MQTLQAIFLGVLQGITEWLPISSEGQTLLTMINWLHISPETAFSYSIFLHLGTMSAVMLKFRREFFEMFTDLNSTLSRTVIVATIFTGISGLPLYLLIKETFSGGVQATLIIGVLLIATGLILRSQRSGTKNLEDVTLLDMIILGLAQGLAILPGISRSGTTMTVLLLRNVRQEISLTLSFLISVPAVIGAVVLDHSYTSISLKTSMAMFLASLIAGYFTMDLLLKFARSIDFSKFCITLGSLTIIITIIL